MNELDALNETLVAEADALLHDHGLLEILQKNGNPVVTGSYILKLMTWRDLDVNLESNEMTVERFFNLGQELAVRLKARRMSYRNETLGEIPTLPRGLYWGLGTALTFPAGWKIDVWAINSDETRSRRLETENLERKLTAKNR